MRVVCAGMCVGVGVGDDVSGCVGSVWGCVWGMWCVCSIGGLKISDHQGGAGISLSSATVRPERTHIFTIRRKEGARKGLGLEPWSVCCQLSGGGHGGSDMVAGEVYGQARVGMALNTFLPSF